MLQYVTAQAAYAPPAPNQISYEDRRLIDEMERERGEAVNRPRIKFIRISEVLDALATRKARAGGDGWILGRGCP